ncbi:MAG: 16S rRNA (cytosine(1402)-N(4))-methyltransferase RsmH [Caldisericia bacterium]|nr:16S rRNA (cytosine(1402)-N(4))-methyltransferase RsmH [Caldisericia bacterium]MDD4613934.1 16S rRNA (cytosine(1402)-N(4))-methyltransferase RsmH [Caldisericia bacterium]
MNHHIPVFGNDIVQLLQLNPDSIVMDCTCGEGGHATMILPHIPQGHYYGFDRDPQVLPVAHERMSKIANNFTLYPSNYTESIHRIQRKEIPQPNAFLADLGISMFQLKSSQRGFSFLSDDLLCMRFDSDEQEMQAYDIVNRYPEKKLADLLYEYGEERASRKIAAYIVRSRQKKHIETCSELASIVVKAKGYPNRHRFIHPATQTFQALRIETNQEMNHLDTLLQSLQGVVRSQGVAAFISYHSIEDRKIKYFFRDSPFFQRWNKKVIKPSDEEIHENPAARSAKLRIGIRNESSSS